MSRGGPEERQGSAPWTGAWPDAERLVERVQQTHGHELARAAAAAGLEYLALLERWASRFNLISARTRDEVVERHLVDSFAVLTVTDSTDGIADVGSGAGFPGLPVAIARPQARVTLIEPRRHRANFLREAARRLSLRNVTVEERRADELEPAIESFGALTGRGIRASELVAAADRLLAPGGKLVIMTKGDFGDAVPEGYEVDRSAAYRLMDGSRHVVTALIRRCST